MKYPRATSSNEAITMMATQMNRTLLAIIVSGEEKKLFQSNCLIRAGGFLEAEMITSAAKKLVGKAEMTVSLVGKSVCVVEIVVLHHGHHCFVYINDRIRLENDRIRSSDDYVQTIHNHDAFRNDRLALENPHLQNGDNRFGPANNRFRYGNSYFPRAVGNSLIRRGLMIAGNNRLYCGNDYLQLRDDYLRSEDDRRCCIDNRLRLGNGSLQQDNDRGRCTNNRSRGGKDRVVDRVGRRGEGNTCLAIVDDCRDMEMIVKETQLIGTTVLSQGKT